MRTKVYLFAACLLAVAVMTGCNSRSVRKDFSFKDPQSEGIVVFSVSHDSDAGRHAQALVYMDGGVASGKGHVFSSGGGMITGFSTASDFGDGYGQLFAVALPVGKHAFDSWQITNRSGLWIYPKEKPAPLVFEVGAGQVKYLGNLHAQLETGKNLFGATAVGDGFVLVRDERRRDVPMFQEQYPQFQTKVVVELLDLGPWVKASGTRQYIEVPIPVVPK